MCLVGFRVFLFLFFKIYLSEREITEHKQREQQAEGETDSPLSREPDVGLNPRTLGLCLEPKADTNRRSHPGVC